MNTSLTPEVPVPPNLKEDILLHVAEDRLEYHQDEDYVQRRPRNPNYR